MQYVFFETDIRSVQWGLGKESPRSWEFLTIFVL